MGTLRIFVSHSHQDNDWCSAFVDELKRYGADIWFDKQSLYVGAKWLEAIETELERCDTFLVVLSPASWSSAWVRDELRLALAQRKYIIGILHKPAPLTGFITNYQMLDVIGLSGVEAAKAAAAALGELLLPSLKPSTVVGMQSTYEPYEYFEASIGWFFQQHFYQVATIDNKRPFFMPAYWSAFLLGRPDENQKADQEEIYKLRKAAKEHGLEELPEKGAEWYSYRFRRKKQ